MGNFRLSAARDRAQFLTFNFRPSFVPYFLVNQRSTQVTPRSNLRTSALLKRLIKFVDGSDHHLGDLIVSLFHYSADIFIFVQAIPNILFFRVDEL